MKQLTKQELRSLNTRLLVSYCVLPVIADFMEDFEHSEKMQPLADELIEIVRKIDDIIISDVKDYDKRLELMEQQVYIQRSFRDWIIQQFGLAQKDIKKIPSI